MTCDMQPFLEPYERMVQKNECAMMSSFKVLRTLGITMRTPLFVQATTGMCLPREGNATVSKRVSKIKNIENVIYRGIGVKGFIADRDLYVDPVYEYMTCVRESIILPMVEKDMQSRTVRIEPLDRMMENVPSIIAYAKAQPIIADDPGGLFAYKRKIRTPEYLKQAAPYYLRAMVDALKPIEEPELVDFAALMRQNADEWESAADSYIELRGQVVSSGITL